MNNINIVINNISGEIHKVLKQQRKEIYKHPLSTEEKEIFDDWYFSIISSFHKYKIANTTEKNIRVY